MKLKSILLTAAATISLATATMAQVPNYVPTNGLVGWWPFNGNANDESGNNNNGNNNGAILTSDRFNNSNCAFDFNNCNYIDVGMSSVNFSNSNFTISLWFTRDSSQNGYLISKRYSELFANFWQMRPNDFSINETTSNDSGFVAYNSSLNQWYNYIVIRDGIELNLFVNGILQDSISTNTILNLSNNTTIKIGAVIAPISGLVGCHYGKIDDIGIWNRALNQQEITDLYTAANCSNNTSITPQSNSLATGSTATYTATTSDPNPTYVWQSDFGQGFQTLNNFGNYSGVNTATLNIANVQLSEHNQPIRVITTSGNCIDTSNVAVINILDTCLVTVYDTLLTTVTDTLIINAQITGINPPNNLNTLKVFPNPASTHITIDYGNFNAMSGYTLTIVNSIGQTVFTTPINQQTSYIDLSTWTGNGIYFVQLIDPQNNTIENRKIVIQ
jgi:hypothetical protein